MLGCFDSDDQMAELEQNILLSEAEIGNKNASSEHLCVFIEHLIS